MKKIVVILLALITSISLSGQSGKSPKKLLKKLGTDPVFFLDSVNIDKSQINKLNPSDIASVTVYDGTDAINLLGEDGKDGVVYMFTKTFAKNSYWNYFKTKSKDYSDRVPSPDSDSTIQYILNKRVLISNFEGDLMLINDNIFKEISLIDKKTLAKDYNILDKDFGVLIISDKPNNLYHAKKKF